MHKFDIKVRRRLEKINKNVKICLDNFCFFPHVIDDIINNYCIIEYKLTCQTELQNIIHIYISLDDSIFLMTNNNELCNFEIYDITKTYSRFGGVSTDNILEVTFTAYNIIEFFNYYMKINYNKNKYINIRTPQYDNYAYQKMSKNIIKKLTIYGNINTFTILNHKKLKNIIVIFKIFIDIVKNNIKKN